MSNFKNSHKSIHNNLLDIYILYNIIQLCFERWINKAIKMKVLYYITIMLCASCYAAGLELQASEPCNLNKSELHDSSVYDKVLPVNDLQIIKDFDYKYSREATQEEIYKFQIFAKIVGLEDNVKLRIVEPKTLGFRRFNAEDESIERFVPKEMVIPIQEMLSSESVIERMVTENILYKLRNKEIKLSIAEEASYVDNEIFIAPNTDYKSISLTKEGFEQTKMRVCDMITHENGHLEDKYTEKQLMKEVDDYLIDTKDPESITNTKLINATKKLLGISGIKDKDYFKKYINSQSDDLKAFVFYSFGLIEVCSAYYLDECVTTKFNCLDEEKLIEMSINALFTNSASELFQIYGVQIKEYDNEAVLYLSTISDFAISKSKGLPFRHSHDMLETGISTYLYEFDYYTHKKTTDALWDILKVAIDNLEK